MKIFKRITAVCILVAILLTAATLQTFADDELVLKIEPACQEEVMRELSDAFALPHDVFSGGFRFIIDAATPYVVKNYFQSVVNVSFSCIQNGQECFYFKNIKIMPILGGITPKIYQESPYATYVKKCDPRFETLHNIAKKIQEFGALGDIPIDYIHMCDNTEYRDLIYELLYELDFKY